MPSLEVFARYLRKGLRGLSGGYVALDASRPWLVYWILHSLDLLESLDEDPQLGADAVATLSTCWDGAAGGFGGGPGQLPHCAPTSAAARSFL